MELVDLLKDIDPIEIKGDINLEIDSITYDSRQIKEGSLFICIKGFKDDGHRFIDIAVESGAKAVIIEKRLSNYRKDVTYIRVSDSREAMSYLGATFYNYPLNKLKLIGVTGTNGKTTTTFLIKEVLERSGIKTGLIGTIKVVIGEKILPSTRTTPESLDLYQIFAKMVETGLTHVIMEVSSHALDLKRVQGMKFKIAIFTNITQDHLDYHHSFKDYLRTKSGLFQQLEEDGYAIANLDDVNCTEIINSSTGINITYGINNKGDYRAEQISLSSMGVSFQVRGRRTFGINLNLTGLFNVYNSLAAIACCDLLGLSLQDIKIGLESVQGVPGRFELIDEGQNFAVVVDYAHTPDGMENVLKTALELVQGRIIIVFGCGGDRDKGKRPLMGKIGTYYADYAFLTSDNPRSEDPLLIIKDIEGGIKSKNYQIISDRKEAIFQAVNLAQQGDMVIIFGKGHETYQIFKDKTIPFDDREIAREAINMRSKGEKK